MEHESEREEPETESKSEARSGEAHSQPVGFSVAWTVICTVLVGAGMGLMVWAYDSLTAIENVENPERALAHIASRSMNLESSLTRGSRWEQSLYQILNGHDDSSKQLIAWYDELTSLSSDPLSSLYAAIIEAEAGDLERMRARIKKWDAQADPFPLFHDILTTAYGEQGRNSEEVIVLQAHLAEEVPDNWFYSQLALQLAKHVGNVSFSRTQQDHIQSRLDQLFWRNRTLMMAEIGMAIVSLVALCILMWRRFHKRHGTLMLAKASLPPPWLGRDGFAVLMRGGALTLLLLSGLGALLGAYFSFIDRTVEPKLMELMSSVILYAPIPFLLYYYILRPAGYSFRQVFGLHVEGSKVGLLILTVLSLFAGGMFGDLIIGFAGEVIGKSTHWTEWFNDSLVWGGASDLTILFIEVAVLAPFFEELIFRGIVFASLRRRFGWLLSAVLSAVIFAIVHGYGIIGFCAVGWSGFLWAWAYEKTGSLWPGIVAHALNNFVFLMSLLVVFR